MESASSKGIAKYETNYLPLHPLANKSGQVLRHRQVLFERIGGGSHPCNWCGSLVEWQVKSGYGDKKTLVADHLDGDPRNNCSNNLVPSCIACNAQRARFGRVENWETFIQLKSGSRQRAVWDSCPICEKKFLNPTNRIGLVTRVACSCSCAIRLARRKFAESGRVWGTRPLSDRIKKRREDAAARKLLPPKPKQPPKPYKRPTWLLNCAHCGVEFEIGRSYGKCRSKNNFCSRKCISDKLAEARPSDAILVSRPGYPSGAWVVNRTCIVCRVEYMRVLKNGGQVNDVCSQACRGKRTVELKMASAKDN